MFTAYITDHIKRPADVAFVSGDATRGRRIV